MEKSSIGISPRALCPKGDARIRNCVSSRSPTSPPGSTTAWLAPYLPFPTADGQVIIAIGSDGQFQRFCAAVNRLDLAQDPRFGTNPDRVHNRPALVELMSAITRSRCSRDWMDLQRELHVPCGPIQDIAQVFEDPQVLARGMKIEQQHPQIGPVPGLANPIKFSKTQQEYPKAPPLLGEDTEEVLARLLRRQPDQIA